MVSMQSTTQIQEKILALLTDYEAAAKTQAKKEMLARLNGPVSQPRIATKAYSGRKPGPKPTTEKPLKERLPELALAYVKKNPDSSILEIAKALGVDAQVIKAPIKKMRVEKILKAKGVAKGTRYRAT